MEYEPVIGMEVHIEINTRSSLVWLHAQILMLHQIRKYALLAWVCLGVLPVLNKEFVV
jgi:Asp-tRNA(Asn)/Glu-tRNA(Gln) amidotransferase B subunit